MKRTLVLYDSSDEEGSNDKRQEVTSTGSPSVAAAPPPRRKLPKLSPALVPPPPTSDPSKHQGRVRTTPHVEGQYAAYVYVHVPLSGECQKLGQLLGRAVRYAREVVGEEVVKCDWLRESDGAESLVHDGAELHISLTRPIFLRAHQRDDLKRAIRDAANTQTSFTVSMASFATFENDERTRAFIGIEVGAGHSEMVGLSSVLSESLRSLRQQIYYSEPRFHASFAWSLLDHRQAHSQPTPAPPDAPVPVESTKSDQGPLSDERPSAVQPFPTIQALPPTLSDELNARFGSDLVHRVGKFDAGEIHAKIGKDVFRWRLGTRLT